LLLDGYVEPLEGQKYCGAISGDAVRAGLLNKMKGTHPTLYTYHSIVATTVMCVCMLKKQVAAIHIMCLCVCLGSKLLPDFFLDVGPEDVAKQMSAEGATPAFYKAAPGGDKPAAKSSSSSSTGGPAAVFKALQGMLSEELVGKVKGVFQFELTGKYTIHILLQYL
jgi:hypothetical protein